LDTDLAYYINTDAMTCPPVAVGVIQRKIREPDSESSSNSDSNSDSNFESNTGTAESNLESEEGDNTPIMSTSDQAGEWTPDPLPKEEERDFDDPGPDGLAPISPDLPILGKDTLKIWTSTSWTSL
jgi:hypothetical protein